MSFLDFLRLDGPPLPDDAPPRLPSPTLTNPDMVLPNERVDIIPALPSPSSNVKGPPSTSYLRDRSNDRMASGKKERRGLMSQKMMLLRSHTGSSVQVAQARIPRSALSDSDNESGPSTSHNSAYASSPTLMDVGNLAPERLDHNRRSTGGSSFNSDELAAIPSFLAKYVNVGNHGIGDDLSDLDSPRQSRYGYSVSIEGGTEEKRKQQEEDEHNSAVLSKRAEQILANAKKRLNLMEGNLRGARDLVAPLTAANLKRATSLGPGHSPYTGRGRSALDNYSYEPAIRQPLRTLHAQASSPIMGRDYHGHAHVFTDHGTPNRPYMAIQDSSPTLAKMGRMPIKVGAPFLRESRSHDSFGPNGTHAITRECPPLEQESLNSNLDPQPEDNASYHDLSACDIFVEFDDAHGPAADRSQSVTGDLREQMSSLKGKISTLKERAREDSLRRQSMQTLRTPSPFNNALATPPELFYNSGQAYGSALLEVNAGIGRASNNSGQRSWEQSNAMAGSRNAFAEQAQRMQQHEGEEVERTVTMATTLVPSGSRRERDAVLRADHGSHQRTSSGTAIIEPATNRYSHHQYTSSGEMPGTYVPEDAQQDPSAWDFGDEAGRSPEETDETRIPDYDDGAPDEDQASVYEDAEYEQPPMVAHEDRDDAFDYKQFWLNTALGSFNNGRRTSVSSEEASGSSVATARGPPTTGIDDDDEDDALSDFDSDEDAPPAPFADFEQRPHKRTLSDESVTTVGTFATAEEEPPSPTRDFGSYRTMAWPVPSSGNGVTAHPDLQPTQGSGQIPRRPESPRRRDRSSERADSGIGISRPPRHTKHQTAVTVQTAASLPARPNTMILHDSTTLAVNALIDPDGKQLGLKDKALLFSLVETVKKVCYKLQEDGEGQSENRVLRRKLDEAKRVLEGVA